MNEFTVKKLAERLDALVPKSPADVERELREGLPIVHRVLETSFPGLWPEIVQAVRKELLVPHPGYEGCNELTPALPVVWDILREGHPARAAVIAALRDAV